MNLVIAGSDGLPGGITSKANKRPMQMSNVALTKGVWMDGCSKAMCS